MEWECPPPSLTLSSSHFQYPNSTLIFICLNKECTLQYIYTSYWLFNNFHLHNARKIELSWLTSWFFMFFLLLLLSHPLILLMLTSWWAFPGWHCSHRHCYLRHHCNLFHLHHDNIMITIFILIYLFSIDSSLTTVQSYTVFDFYIYFWEYII